MRARRAPPFVLVAITATVLLCSCRGPGEASPPPTVTTTAPEITVSGTVSMRRGDHAILVGSDNGQSVLVVTLEPMPPAVVPGTRIRASGRVRVFEPDALASEFHLGFDGAAFADLLGSDCLVSVSVGVDG
jgi:hypothetical protein